MPQSNPPNSVTTRGPYLSTNQPSIGTSQVSSTTKMVKAIWMEGLLQPYFSLIGLTKRVQPYWRLAIIDMQITPMVSCTHRFVAKLVA